MFLQSLDKHAALDQTKTRTGVQLDNEEVVVCGGFFCSVIKWAQRFFLQTPIREMLRLSTSVHALDPFYPP